MKHADLIARLEKLTGPDTCLDEAIWEAIGGWPSREWRSTNYMKAFGTPLTASIDAAVALVERLLPGWCWDVGSTHRDFLRDGEHTWGASLAGPVTWKPDEYGYDEPCYSHIEAREATPAVALLIALLRALQESDPAAKDEAQ